MSFKNLMNDARVYRKIRFFEPHSYRKPYFITKRLPIIKELYSKNVLELYKIHKGHKAEADGYLQYLVRNNKLLTNKIIKMMEEHNLDVHEGFKLYDFYVEPAMSIPTEIIIVSSLLTQISSDLPYHIKVIKLGKAYISKTIKTIFYLVDEPKSTILKLPKINYNFPTLDHKELMKVLSENSSLSLKDRHIFNSVLSPYIGSKWLKNCVDGIGNSYMSNPNIKKDLSELNEVLDNEHYGIPLNHFGILNILNKSVPSIEKMRFQDPTQKLNVLSWNLPSTIKINNFRDSEFKYNIGNINFDIKNISQNIALQHSLISYAILKEKRPSYALYDEIMIKSVNEINSWLNKANEKNVFQIIDMRKIDIQVGRIASYFLGLGYDTDEVIKLVVDTIHKNIASILEDFPFKKISSKRERIERQVNPMIRLAFHNSDRTQQGFIDQIIDLLGWTDKHAADYVKQLEEQGSIFRVGKRYHWINERKFDFQSG